MICFLIQTHFHFCVRAKDGAYNYVLLFLLTAVFMTFHVTLLNIFILFITTANMLNSLVRNVGQRFARNQSLVKHMNDTINCTASRHFKSLSNTNKPLNQSHQNHQQWSQIQSPNLHCNFYSTDPPNEDEPSAKVDRKFPKLNNDKIAVSPPFFAFFKFTWKALQIRNLYDADFSLNEFVEGSKKAVEVNDLLRFFVFFFNK